MTPTTDLPATPRARALLALALVAIGCGDTTYTLNPGSIDAVPATELLAWFDGAAVELARFSTTCSKSSAKTLTAEVGDTTEFPAEMVATIDSPCAEGPNPGIVVQIERDSVVFDFSEVGGRNRFPSAEFDGYIIDLALTSRHALLIATAIDRERTTLGVDSDDITFEPDHIEINLESVAYGPGSMLTIDLLFANVPAMPAGGD